MKILFTGGRTFCDRVAVISAMRILEQKFKDFEVIVGDASGLDALVRFYTTNPVSVFYADWEEYGKSAGVLRNKRMVESGIDLCVAFPGGRGTTNCVDQVSKLGIPVWYPVQTNVVPDLNSKEGIMYITDIVEDLCQEE